MTLGERICQYRVQRRLSQQEVAEKLEVSRQSVSKWETDGAVPELDKLVKLCELFEVTLDELVRGEKPKEVKAEGTEPPDVERPAQEEISPKPRERSITQVALGAVLLAVGLIGAFSVLVLPWGIGQGILLLAVPMAICGILCLTLRNGAGLACAGVAGLAIMIMILLPEILSVL